MLLTQISTDDSTGTNALATENGIVILTENGEAIGAVL